MATQLARVAGPAARAVLRGAGLALEDALVQQHASGPRGALTKTDALRAAAAALEGAGGGALARGGVASAASASASGSGSGSASASASASGSGSGSGSAAAAEEPAYVDVPHTNVRRVIARRLWESKAGTPHSYFSADVRLDALAALRRAMREERGAAASVNDFVIRAAALALERVPRANAAWDAGAGAVVPNAAVDVAVAVATDGGLITPIVRGANAKSVYEIQAEVKDLAARARANKLKPEEFQGGSFSISNLGMFGIGAFSAIINPPQACIMAVGGAKRGVAFGPTGVPEGTTSMTVTLSADERVYDAATTGAFLEAFKTCIENPAVLVL